MRGQRSGPRQTLREKIPKVVYGTSQVSLRGIFVLSLTRRSHDSSYFSRVTVLSELLEPLLI